MKKINNYISEAIFGQNNNNKKLLDLYKLVKTNKIYCKLEDEKSLKEIDKYFELFEHTYNILVEKLKNNNDVFIRPNESGRISYIYFVNGFTDNNKFSLDDMKNLNINIEPKDFNLETLKKYL